MIQYIEEPDNAEERYLKEQIHLLRLSYEEAIKPYVDRLVMIRSMRIAPVMIQIRGVTNAMKRLNEEYESQVTAPCPHKFPISECNNMRPVAGDKSMAREYYECKVCRKRESLDYDEMR